MDGEQARPPAIMEDACQVRTGTAPRARASLGPALVLLGGEAILRIADGRVAELRGTADRLGMLTQLGILPDIGWRCFRDDQSGRAGAANTR
jgi:hypothetical protein